MLIYIFTEFYPSPYKPYFDTQFAQFIEDGHEIKIFSADSQSGELESKVIKYKLNDKTHHLPTDLSSTPSYFLKILRMLLSNPVEKIMAVMRCFSSKDSIKQNYMNIIRVLVLPVEGPDLCFVHNLTTAIHLNFLRSLYVGTPIAFYYHGGEVVGVPQIDYKISKIAFKNVDYVFTNSKSSKSHAINRGCQSNKITVCPVGFDIEEFKAEDKRLYKIDGVLKLLTIGRMSKEKGHIYALKAVKILIEQGVTNINYKLIGGGPLFSDLKKYVIENELSNYVEFMGHLSRDDLYAQLKGADVHILPSIIVGSWQENQACVVQEAMLFKTLVINSTSGGVPESTSPAMQEFNVEPGKPDIIADQIKKIMAMNNIQMSELANSSRQFVIENYDIKNINKNILSISTNK